MAAKFPKPYRTLTAGELRRWLGERQTAVPDGERVKVEVRTMGSEVVVNASLMMIEIKGGEVMLVAGYPGLEENLEKGGK